MEEQSRVHVERVSEGDDVAQRDVALTALDGTHVRRVKAGELGNCLLTQAELEATLAYAGSELPQRVAVALGHRLRPVGRRLFV